MLNISLLKKAKTSSFEQGFTMLEVLAAILITTAFTAVAMQLMVINAIYKIKAQLQAQALFWVQEDQEKIMAMADSLTSDSSKCTSTTDSYTVALWKQLEPNSSSSLPSTSDSTLILNDTGSNDDNLVKSLLTGTNKTYQLQRTYKIKTDTPEILIINYKVVAPENSDSGQDKLLIKTNFEVKPNAYYECTQ